MRTPSEDYHRLAVLKPAKLPKGADALAQRVAGWWRRRRTTLEKLQSEAARVEAMESRFEALEDAALRASLAELGKQFRRSERKLTAERRIEGLAAVRETARRR